MNIRKQKVAVVGARGYAGLELCKLLLAHPAADLSAAFATDQDWKLSDLLFAQGADAVQTFSTKDLNAQSLAGMHTVFLATPNEVSLGLAPVALEAGANVVDLSGAFRLNEAPYGLVPWAGPVARAHGPVKIANPGCYATSVLMAILPLLKAGLVRPETLVIDAKSGATGAGKKAAENLLFTEVADECLPYRVGRHQHVPEIQLCVEKIAGMKIDPFFTTHLLPVRRGIISSIYFRLSNGVTAKEIAQAFSEAYRDYPLVRVREGESNLLSLKQVAGTPFTHISYVVNGDKLFLFSLIDNLLKGAASQAVENFNRLSDLPIETGLQEVLR